MLFLFFSCDREPLNKSSSAAAESFAPAMQFKKQEIHTVFLCFLNFYLGQNLLASALADLIRASIENKKSSANTAEDKKFLWYHLSLPPWGPHGILTDPQAVPGHTRLRLLLRGQSMSCFSKATPKGIPRQRSHCLAATGSSLRERMRCVLVFITVLFIRFCLV